MLVDSGACAAHEWLFIISAGRAGSTTLLQMLNIVPTIFLSGENIDVLPNLLNLYDRSAQLGRRSGGLVTSHSNAPDDTVLRNLVCSWVLNMLPTPSAAVKPACVRQRCFRGFKELWGHGELSLLPAIHTFFPGAFIVNNFRGVAGGLSASPAAIAEANVWATNESAALVKEYSTRFGRRWLDVPLEELASPHTFNRLLRWLGVGNCSFSRVVHANNGSLGSQQYRTIPSTEGVLAGRCHHHKHSNYSLKPK